MVVEFDRFFSRANFVILQLFCPKTLCSYVVDYIGIANHLYDALKMYDGQEQEDTIGAMDSVDTEIPILKDRYLRLIALFKDNGITAIEDYVNGSIKNALKQYSVLEECVVLMADIKIRADFEVKLKHFLISMDIIMPNIAANDYIMPMKAFGHIHNRIMQRYKDTTINIMGAGGKVKKLINEHLVSLGIDPKMPPTELFSPDFKKNLDYNKTKKASASEMEHAIRKHCKINIENDPVLYQRLSEKLQNIITTYKDDVEARYEQLISLLSEIWEGRKESKETSGLDQIKEAPFYELLIQRAFNNPDNITEDIKEILKDEIRIIVKDIISSISIIDFWTSKYSEQSELRSKIDDTLLFSNIDEVIDCKDAIVCDFMDLAKKKHNELVK